LLIRDGRVVGVSTSGGQGREDVFDADMVVLAAGAIRSPMVLMHSGIGPAAHLRELGISVLLDRPGVGTGLQDHPAITVSAWLGNNVRPAQGQRRNYAYCRYSSGHAGCRPSDMVMAAVYRSTWHAIGQRVATLSTFMGQAFSRGHVRLVSADPSAEPDVLFNHLVDERDRRRMMDAVRFSAEIFRSAEVHEVTSDVFPSRLSEKVKKLNERTLRNDILTRCGAALMDVSPSARRRLINTVLANNITIDELLNDERALERFVLDTVIPGYHPGGTCRMGDPRDNMTVVDPKGALIGIQNLYVCDASVMPELPRTNINLPTIMIAERIAAMLQ
jgi:5-(hydroxymethyl)furfural/furfural oxidase